MNKIIRLAFLVKKARTVPFTVIYADFWLFLRFSLKNYRLKR
jgi:hypothetical protein